MQEIPKPTSMKPKELMITFIAIDSKTPPNRAETKKPIQIKLPEMCIRDRLLLSDSRIRDIIVSVSGKNIISPLANI